MLYRGMATGVLYGAYKGILHIGVPIGVLVLSLYIGIQTQGECIKGSLEAIYGLLIRLFLYW